MSAARLRELGAEEGTTVVAETQTAGRGRHGRVWFSPPGAGLYVSVVLRPSGEPRRRDPAALLTLASGVAVAEAVRAAPDCPRRSNGRTTWSSAGASWRAFLPRQRRRVGDAAVRRPGLRRQPAARRRIRQTRVAGHVDRGRNEPAARSRADPCGNSRGHCASGTPTCVPEGSMLF